MAAVYDETQNEVPVIPCRLRRNMVVYGSVYGRKWPYMEFVTLDLGRYNIYTNPIGSIIYGKQSN